MEHTDSQQPLAIMGGAPVRPSNLPYGRQTIDDRDIAAVAEVLKGDYLTTGPTVRAFERKIADYVGAKYAVTFSNGTAALHGAAFAAGVRSGDEVITSAMTFAASANCALYTGGTPVFADIQPDTYNIDQADIGAKITPKTKAVVPVHYTGQPADMDEINAIAKQHGLIVIEDAAHALGASYKGRKVGALSDMTVFSMHPVKPITTGEGGAVTTNDKDLYERLMSFRTHGITRDPHQLVENHGPWYYEMQHLGYNYRLTDIQAALGLSQIDKLDEYVARRAEIAKQYTAVFENMPELTVPYQKSNRDSGWHIYVIQLNLSALKVGRRQVFDALQAENIGVNVHYIPVYYHPYYQQLGYRRGLCPEAEKLYEGLITLPLFPKMTDADIQDVITAVDKVLGYYSLRR